MDPDLARMGLAVLWFVAALGCARRLLRTGGGAWWLAVNLGLVLASIPLLRWNVWILHEGQALLRGAGVYDDRTAVKLGIMAAGAVAAAAVLFVLRHRIRAIPAPARRVLLPMSLALLYVAALTLSLDNFMPAFMAGGDGRFLVEFGFGAWTLFHLWQAEGRS